MNKFKMICSLVLIVFLLLFCGLVGSTGSVDVKLDVGNNSSSSSFSVLDTVDLCNISISLISSKDIYETGERIEFYNNLSNKKFDFEIEYYIADDSGNVVKKLVVTKNLAVKHYTPKIMANDRNLTIRNRLVSVGCNNVGSILEAEKEITVKGNPSFNDPSLKKEVVKIPVNKTKTLATVKNSKSNGIITLSSKNNSSKVDSKDVNDYTLKTFNLNESLLNAGITGNTVAEISISGNQKAKQYLPYMVGLALLLMVIYIYVRKNGNESKNSS